MILEKLETKQEKGESDAERTRFQEYIKSKLGSIIRLTSQNNEINSSNEDTSISLPNSSSTTSKLSEVNNLACLAQSISSYLITAQTRKSGDQLKTLTIKLYDAVNKWLSCLFRFHDSSTLFHDQEFEGLVRMCNMMLNFKYESYQTKAYLSISRQPVIYVSEASKYSQPEIKELVAIQVKFNYQL